MDRRSGRPTYRFRFAVVVAAVVLCCVVLGLVQVGTPRSGWDWVAIVVLGALSIAAMVEGWWGVRHHFPIFPRRPGDD